MFKVIGKKNEMKYRHTRVYTLFKREVLIWKGIASYKKGLKS